MSLGAAGVDAGWLPRARDAAQPLPLATVSQASADCPALIARQSPSLVDDTRPSRRPVSAMREEERQSDSPKRDSLPKPARTAGQVGRDGGGATLSLPPRGSLATHPHPSPPNSSMSSIIALD